MGDTETGSWGSRELGGFIRREEARKEWAARPAHTPGPWELQHYTNHIGFSIWAPNAGCIAERWYPTENNDTPIEANARLIAAAPELLALAKHILAMETDPYFQGHPEWEAFLNEAKAAENKAEGRS